MFAARFATAVGLLLVFCGALFLLPNQYWGVFLLAVLGIASLEWAALAGYRGGARWLFAAAVVGSGLALLFASGYGVTASASAGFYLCVYWIAAAFWLTLAPIWLMGKWRTRNPVVLGAAGWIVLVPMWLGLTALQTAPGHLLALLGVVWVADTAAYVIGRRIGRHRLAPRISPGKTWEGAIGACVAVAVYYAVLWFVFGASQPLPDPASGMILFAIVTVMSVQGDLFESCMKREASVKGSGTLLPGHGGVLDRIDGLTASVPIAALWLHYLGRPGIV
jgi:phosphatidate cytidylyltransferase